MVDCCFICKRWWRLGVLRAIHIHHQIGLGTCQRNLTQPQIIYMSTADFQDLSQMAKSWPARASFQPSLSFGDRSCISLLGPTFTISLHSEDCCPSGANSLPQNGDQPGQNPRTRREHEQIVKDAGERSCQHIQYAANRLLLPFNGSPDATGTCAGMAVHSQSEDSMRKIC